MREGEVVTEAEIAFAEARGWDSRWAVHELTARHFPSIGRIYFIQSGTGGPTKIGFTKRAVRERLSALQIGNPHRLHLAAYTFGSPALEREIHGMFRPFRLGGEWFDGSAFGLGDLMAYYRDIETALAA